MNLVANARDAMPGIGKLLLETANVARDEKYARANPGWREGRYVMLAVSDTGVVLTKRRRAGLRAILLYQGGGQRDGLGYR
jgi:signal transduction histidine kinase